MRSAWLTATCAVRWASAIGLNAYDLGFHGLYPTKHYHSVDIKSPDPQYTKWDSRCDYGSLFLTPRGPYVMGQARGPIIMDPRGELIWHGHDDFEQVLNLNVQQYKGQEFLTFWTKEFKNKKNKHKKHKHKHGNKDKHGPKHDKKKGDKKHDQKHDDEPDEEREESYEYDDDFEGEFGQEFKAGVEDDHEEYSVAKKSKNKHGKKKLHSVKSYVMLNSAYEVAHRIKPHGKHYKADSHEFRITPQGTALITIYHKRKTDCTQLSLGKECWIQDGLFQEIDIETGKLLFEWRATDHISMREVFTTPNRKDGYGTSKQDAFDFFHINAVDKNEDGNYIVSARYMHAILCISSKTGEVLWQLGGKHNSFKDKGGALNFAWQHHVTWLGNNTLSLFDNHENTVLHTPEKHSKAMIVQLDLDQMTAKRTGRFVHPKGILNVSQGSIQIVPESGNVLVGFGNAPTYVEYTRDGHVLCAAHWAADIAYQLVDFGLAKSYRVFKHSNWVGRPKTEPDVAVKNGKAYVSWNGATEVTAWRLERAISWDARSEDFNAVRDVKKDGFETSFDLSKHDKYVRVIALDAHNNEMARSAEVKVIPPPSRFLRTMLSFSGFALMLFLLVALLRKFRIRPSLPRLTRMPERIELKSGLSMFSKNRNVDTSDPERSPLLEGESRDLDP